MSISFSTAFATSPINNPDMVARASIWTMALTSWLTTGSDAAEDGMDDAAEAEDSIAEAPPRMPYFVPAMLSAALVAVWAGLSAI